MIAEPNKAHIHIIPSLSCDLVLDSISLSKSSKRERNTSGYIYKTIQEIHKSAHLGLSNSISPFLYLSAGDQFRKAA